MIVDWAEDNGKVDLDPKSYLAAAPGRVDELYSGPASGIENRESAPARPSYRSTDST